MRRRSIQRGGIARSVVASGAAVCLIVTVAASCLAQQAAVSLPDSTSSIKLVRAAVANEVAASNDASVKHMFRSRRETRGKSQTRLYVETQDAMAGMTIAYDDHPLSPQQMQDERARLDRLQASPEELKRKHSQEKNDADHTLRIVRALPDAFLYEYDGRENSTPVLGRVGDELIRLKFRPNPSYSPPSRVEEVLKGMQGVVLIDPVARRIARIDGTLFREVTFGWGFFGHLNKGGHFCVEQGALGDGSWDVTHMQLAFAGKILMVKSLNISSNEVFSDFRRVPSDTTFAKGVEMLKAEDARLAANQTLRGPVTTGPKSH
ncbi:MAG: hypothetical protein WB562_04515 [Candidatus Sulfotelmatobacter sp.]